MKNIIETFVLNLLTRTSSKEQFEVDARSELKNMMNYQLLAQFIAIIIVNALVLLFGKFLWNNYLVKLVSGVKQIDSVWQLLAISILLKMLF